MMTKEEVAELRLGDSLRFPALPSFRLTFICEDHDEAPSSRGAYWVMWTGTTALQPGCIFRWIAGFHGWEKE